MTPTKHIASRFEKAAERYPDALAIDFEGEVRLTYADLKCQAEALACRLASKVTHGELVPVMVPRCPEQVVAILAIQLLGAAYVPIDIDGPPQRLASILESVRPEVVIGFPPQIASLGVNYKPLNSIICDPSSNRVPGATQSLAKVRRPRNRDDLAAVLFTSGSTGEPKGVMLTHRNLMDPVDFLIRCEDLSDGSRLFQFPACSFDVHLVDILCSVFSGACLCQVSRNNMLSDLAGWIDKMQGSVIHLTPSVMSTLTPSQIPSVKYMITCGEPISESLLKTWGDAVVLRNAYGPCEADLSTSMIMTSSTDPTLIGSTPFYSDVVVLDDQLRPASPGVTGEIYCRGTSVSPGYWARHKLTEERFVNLPGVHVPGSVHRGKWHKTGDLGTMLENGLFRIGARVDDQIKMGGQRVELGELERILAPSAPRVLVVGKKDRQGQTKPFAIVSESTRFCSANESCTLSDHRCRLGMAVLEYGQARLAQHMPRVVMASSIPMTLGGKIDKIRLDSLLADYLDREASSASELDEEEYEDVGCLSHITKFLSTQLQAPGIPSDEPLTSWGLTSLDAIRLLGEIYRAFSVSLSVEDIIRLGTIRSIASLVESQRLTHADLGLPGKDTTINGHIPVPAEMSNSTRASTGQTSILMAEYRSRNFAFNCNVVKEISSAGLQPKKVFEAIRTVCSRHEALRTTFQDPLANATGSAVFHRTIHDIADVPPAELLLDLSSDSSRESAKEEALRIADAQLEALFDLEKDSPVRTVLYQLEPTGTHWILQFVVHHAAIDEWSFVLFCTEVEKTYSQLVDGTSAPNPVSNALSSTSSYSSFVNWELGQMDDETLRRNTVWWADRASPEHVADFSGFLLPETHAPKSKPSQENEFLYKSLPAASVQAFHRKFSQHKTPFVSWLALAQQVLCRMSGRSQFLLGMPVSKRGARAGFDDVIGYFLNNTVVPVDVEEGDSFRALMMRTAETVAECNRHSMPFGEILGALSDNASQRAQVDIVFTYHDRAQAEAFAARSPADKHDLRINDAPTLPLNKTGAEHNLVIHIDVHAEEPQVFFEFRSGSCERYVVESMAYAFEAALDNLLSHGADQPLATLPISKTETHPSNPFTTSPYSSKMASALARPETISIPCLLGAAFSKYPGSVAVRTTKGQSITYRTLEQMVEARRRQFRKLGLGPGRVVGFYLDKSLDLVTTQLAVLTLGAVTFFLDIAPNAVVNKTKVETAKPDFLFHDAERADDALELLNGLTGAPAQLVDVSRPLELQTGGQPGGEPVNVRPSEIAFLWFTSGSTGRPKCFTVPHYALASCILANSENYRLSPGHTQSLLCNTTFDPTLLDLFQPLIAGATLGIASTNELLTDMAKAISDLSITHITGTPRLLGMIDGGHEAVPSVRFILLTGEPLSPALLNEWSYHVDLYNGYGPGETGSNAHANRASTRGDPACRAFHETQDRCVGRPYSTVRSYILDAKLNLALPGCHGMMHIGDKVEGVLGHLSTGYMSPESANSKFIQHPEYGRLYNTGDICFYDSAGDAHFVGRADDQVKLNGIRFCLGDIDAELLRCTPAQAEAVSLLCETKNSDSKSLVVFFGLRQDFPPKGDNDCEGAAVLPLDGDLVATLSKIRDHMALNLPHAILPRFWVPVNRIPQSRNGKTDRKALQDLFSKEESQQRLHVYAALKESTNPSDEPQERQKAILAPRQTSASLQESHVARLLAETWAKVLSMPLAEIDQTISFFKAGGDSILAIKFCSELRKNGVMECTVLDMYKNPTLKALVETISRPQKLVENSSDITSHAIFQELSRDYRIHDNLDPTAIKAALSQSDISPAAVDQVYKVNAMQASMVLQSMSNAEMYSIQQIWHLAGDVNFELLNKCFDTVVQAEPALRTTFIPAYLESSMEIAAIQYREGAQSVDVKHKELSADASFQLTLSEDRRKGFRLGQEMLRVSVFSDEKGFHHRVVVTMHHALVDGWSYDRLIDQITRAYNGQPLKTGRSIAGHAINQLGSTESKQFWREELRSFPKGPSHGLYGTDTALCIPQASHIRRVLPQTFWKKLESACRRMEITPVTLFQASLAVMISQLSDRSGVAFNMSRSGREAVPEGFGDEMGMFLDVMPFHIRLDENISVARWLQGISTSFLRCLSHADLSFDEITQETPARRLDLGAMLSFTNPNMLNVRQLSDKLAFTDCEAHNLSTYLLSMTVYQAPSGMCITLKADAARIPEHKAAQMLEQSIVLLGLLASKDNETSRLPELLNKIPQHAVDISASQLIHSQSFNNGSTLLTDFTQSALQNGDKPAVVGEDDQVSYQKLEERSTALAQLISKRLKGTTRNTVPILYEPSVAMVVTIMAILKSGNAYCPLDMDWPAERLTQMLQQINGDLILASKTGSRKIQGHCAVTSNILNTSGLSLKADRDFPLPGFGVDAPAYCIFTSGSTGKPKGCVLSHSAARNAVKETSKTFQLTSQARVMLCANYIFDASILDIFGSLTTGATLFCPPRADVLEDLPRLIKEFRPTFLHLTPTMISTLPAESLLTVQTLVSGGEKLPPALTAKLPAQLEVFDGYGPTEAAVQVSASRVDKSAPTASLLTALPGSILLLINSNGIMASPGEEAELHIGGSQLMTSYLHDDEMTKKSIMSFDWLPHLPLYATGDFGKYTDDMGIQLLGRKDDQLKVSGQRVECAEVERVLNSCTGVLQSCIVSRGEGLHAFIRATHPASTRDGLQAIRAHCRAHLPSTWVPSLSVVDQIATTASLKVDRRKMAELVSTLPAPLSPEAASREDDEIYRWLNAVLQNLLATFQVQPSASLFDQGLNSIGFIRLKGLITQRCSTDISISTLRSLGSLEKIYEFLRGTQMTAEESVTAARDAQTCVAATEYPALHPQVTMWVAQERLQDHTYNVDRIMQFNNVDASRLFHAVSSVAHSLDIFKTTFRWDHDAGHLKQLIYADSRAKTELHREFSKITMDEAAESILKQQNSSSLKLDLTNGPIARFHIYELRENACCLYYNWHHILTDNFTSSFVLERIFDLYLRKEESLLVDTTGSLALELEKSNNHTALINRSLLKWQDALAGFQSLDLTSHLGHLSAGNPVQPTNIRRASTIDAMKIPAHVLHSLHDIARATQTSLFTVLLAAWQILLHKTCSQDDLTTTTPVSMRGAYPNSERVLGNLTNTVLIRTQLLKTDSFTSFLERTRCFLEFGLDNCLVPLDHVLRKTGHGFSDHSASFAMVEERRSHSEIGMIDHTLDLLPQSSTRFDLNIWALSSEGDMKIFADYDSSRLGLASTRGLVQSFVNLLGELRLGLPLDTVALKPLNGTQAEETSLFKTLANVPSLSSSGISTPLTSRAGWSDDGTSYPSGVLVEADRKLPSAIMKVRTKDGLPCETGQVGNVFISTSRASSEKLGLSSELVHRTGLKGFVDENGNVVIIDKARSLSPGSRGSSSEAAESLDDESAAHSSVQEEDPDPAAHSSSASSASEEPDATNNDDDGDDGTRQKVREACTRIIGNVELKDDEDLFLAGLDSFLSMSLVSTLRRELGKFPLTLFDIVTHSSISAISQLIEDRLAKSNVDKPKSYAAPTAECPVERITEPHQKTIRSIPANLTEERFFKLQEIFDDSTYNLGAVYNITGHSVERVMSALKDIARRNEVFRSAYARDDGVVKQYIHPEVPAGNFSVEDFSALSLEDAHQNAKDSIWKCWSELYIMEEPALFRCRAITVSDDLNVLFLGMHHIIGDEQSLSLLASEIFRLCHDNDDVISMDSYNHLEGLESLAATEKQEQLQPSQEYLDSLSCLQNHEPILVTDMKGSGGGQNLGTHSHSFCVDSSLFDRSIRPGATAFSVLFFCYQILWRTRFERSEDALLIPVSSRLSKTEMNTYGNFINTIPAGSQLDLTESVASNFQHSLLKLQEALENRAVPFESILEHSALKKDIFETMFVFHEERPHSSNISLAPMAEFMPNETKLQQPKFPFTLSVTRKPGVSRDELHVNIDFDSGIISDKTVEYLAHGYEQICIALQTSDPSQPLHSLDTLSAMEKSDLRKFGNLDRPYLVHQAIQEMVERAPDATCVVFEGTENVTYGQFWAKVEHISNKLAKYYTGSDSKIAIFQDASVDRIATIVASVRSGFAYVPLDLQNPDERTLAILDDCKPAAVLVSDAGSDEYMDSVAHLRSLISDLKYTSMVSLSPEQSTEDASYTDQLHVNSSDLAYILYTSGSTGKPKGVAVEHGSLFASATEHVKIYELKPASRLLQIAAWTFDVSVVDIFSTLMAGGTLCIGRKDFLLSDLTKALKSMDITHVATTPTLIGMVSRDDVPLLQNLAIGGEPMTRHVRDLWVGRKNFRNVYGPTETTVNVVSHKVQQDKNIRTIGKPLDTVQAYILDETLYQVSPWMTGQLAIGGDQVARGYLNLQTAHGTGFVQHPQFGKLFLTGDLAYFDQDGDIVCLGRRDNQVKLHGLRIELDEIESIAKSVPLVQDAAAMIIQRQETEVLALVIKPAEHKGSMSTSILLELTPNLLILRQVADTLRSKLPPHSIPSYWIPVKNVPTNKNGKLARKELAGILERVPVEEMTTYSTPTLQQDTNSASHSTRNDEERLPQSPQEVALAKSWCQVLGISHVHLDANFFGLSGDSIAAIRLCGLVKQQGYSLRLRDVYRCPKLGDLAAIMVKKADDKKSTALIAVTPDSGEIHPTPIMARFLGRDKFNVHWYNQSKLLKLRRGISADCISSALNAVFSVHPAFRMRCTEDGDRTNIVIAKPASQNPSLNHQEVDSLEDIAETYQDLQACLDITSGPIAATTTFDLEGETYLALVVHHLAIDVVSWRILLGDLDQALRGEKLLPEETSLLELPLHALHTSFHSNGDYREDNVNPFLLTDGADADGVNIIGSSNRLTLQVKHDALPRLLQGIESSSSDIQLVDFLVASFLQALRAWRGPDNITLDFESHGRNHNDSRIDLTRTVGWFTDIIRVKFDVCEQDTLLERVSAERREWQTSDQPANTLAGTLGSILFNYKGLQSDTHLYRDFELVDMDPGSLEDPMNARDCALEVESEVSEGVIRLGIAFSKALQSEEDINSLLQAWSTCISQLADPDGAAEDTEIADCERNPALQRLSLTADEEKELVESSFRRYDINEEDVTDVTLATDVQTSMVLSSLDNGAFMNDYCYAIHPQTGFDLDRFKKAWTNVLDSFDVFRTVFVPCELSENELAGELLQVVLKPDPTQHDFSVNGHTMSKGALKYGTRLSHLWIEESSQGQGPSRLYWRCHHALVDGTSTRIILNLIHQVYRNASIPEPTLQFVDISQHLIASYRNEETLEFWRKNLSDATTTCLLDHTYPLVEQQPVTKTYEIQADVQSRALSDEAARQRCTVSTLLRAAWAMTISYYTSRDDIIFGIVSSGRALDIDGIEGVVGPCVNTVPFRMVVNWDEKADTYLQAVHAASVDLAEHDFLPLRQIYRASGTSNLFSTVLEYKGQQRGGAAADVPYQMLVEDMHEPNSFPLRITVYLQEDGRVSFHMTCHEHYFKEHYLRRLAGTFDLALQHMSSSSSSGSRTPLKNVNLLDLHHKRQLWSNIQGPAYPDEKNKSMCEIFEDQVNEEPERTAVQFMTAEKTVNTTYSQLFDLTLRAAAVLQRAGVRHGDRVGLFMDKSAEMVACMLAVMRIGAAYVPVDHSVPLKRLEDLLAEASCMVVICSRKDRNRLGHLRQTVLALEEVCRRRPTSPAPSPSIPSTEDIAAILFTSGTTGKPKGVQMPHRQLAGYAVICAEAYGYSKTSRVFSFARYNFDVSLTDIFSTLSVGGTICMSPHSLVVGDFIPTLQRSEANAVNLTNSVASLLRPDQLPCLTHLMLTGEANSKALFETWGDIVHVSNAYGPTEAVAINNHHASARSDPQCVGRPLPGMDVMLLDSKLRLAPIGTAGEIVTAGRQLSIGYLNRPEETAKAFVSNPFKPGTKMYLTGDLGVYDTEGRLCCLGRRDHQIKIHGQRVELGEIESILSTPEIPVTVLYFKSAARPPKLVLFFRSRRTSDTPASSGDCRILTNSTSDPTAQRLMQSSAQLLPAYMIPSTFVGISNVPLTPNGKVDRKSLQKVYEDFLANGSAAVIDELAPPETATEKALVEIIRKMLRVETVSVTADLVETTIDSLSVMRLAATIRRVIGFAASMQWVMRARTIRVMASRIDHEMKGERELAAAVTPSPAPKTEDVVPVSKMPEPSNAIDADVKGEVIEAFTTLLRNPDKPRVYCIHGSSGLSTMFRRLTPFFRDIEMIGINNTRFGQGDAWASVQDMARDYFNRLVSHNKEGPYLIASFSFGDSIAIEVGRLLLAHGKPVYLILIDSDVERTTAYKIPSVAECAELAFDFGMLDRSQPLTDEDREFMHQFGVEWQRNLKNLNKFRMKPYAGPVTFIKAFETRQAEADGSETLTNGYDNFIPSLKVEKMYGEHNKLFFDENYLKDLGACWRSALDQGLQYFRSQEMLLG